MSVAACGGGKTGSDDDDDREEGRRDEKKRIGLAQLLDKTEDNDEITNTKLTRQITVQLLHRPTARPPPIEKKISTSFDDLKGMGMEDGKELRAEDEVMNKKRILNIHVMSALYKMSGAPEPFHGRPKKEDHSEKKKKKTKTTKKNSK